MNWWGAKGVITCKGVVTHGANIDVGSVEGVTYGTMDASAKTTFVAIVDEQQKNVLVFQVLFGAKTSNTFEF
jgi:hypothetical protein